MKAKYTSNRGMVVCRGTVGRIRRRKMITTRRRMRRRRKMRKRRRRWRRRTKMRRRGRVDFS